jgi:hypothetical protein
MKEVSMLSTKRKALIVGLRAVVTSWCDGFRSGMESTGPILIGGSVALAGAGLLGVLSACTAEPSPWDPPAYPEATPVVSGSPSPHPTGVIVLPESYTELRTICDHGNRVYVACCSGDPVMWVVANDPSCKEEPQ